MFANSYRDYDRNYDNYDRYDRHDDYLYRSQPYFNTYYPPTYTYGMYQQPYMWRTYTYPVYNSYPTYNYAPTYSYPHMNMYPPQYGYTGNVYYSNY